MTSQSHFPVIVVGAGIVGASIALHLARHDVRVLLLDRQGPAAGISGRSFGWINALQTRDKDYFSLRLESLREYRQLHQRYPDDIRPERTGSLLWHLPETDLEAICAELNSTDYLVRMINKQEILVLEPGLPQAPDCAAFAEADCSIDPQQTTHSFIRLAVAHGARFEQDCQVSRLLADDHIVRGLETSAGRLTSDIVILAAGLDTAALCRTVQLTIPLTQSAGLILTTKPTASRCLRRIVQTPELRMRQDVDGRIVACIDIDDSNAQENADRLAADLARKIGDVVGVAVTPERSVMSYRTIPEDGRPVVGRPENIDGVYVAVMHSGVTLAPLVGRLVAEEITSNTASSLLREFTPNRFQ